MYWVELTDVNLEENNFLRLDDLDEEQLKKINDVMSELGFEIKFGTYNPMQLQGGCFGVKKDGSQTMTIRD